jgi:hypothetical protein
MRQIQEAKTDRETKITSENEKCSQAETAAEI